LRHQTSIGTVSPAGIGRSADFVSSAAPWDGGTGQYFGLFEYPDVATPGGRYTFERCNRERGEIIYLFRHAGARRCGSRRAEVGWVACHYSSLGRNARQR
jgi:hypothetical protein